MIGVVNVVGSAIGRACGQGVFLHAGPEISVASTKALTNMTVTFAMLGVMLGRIRDLNLDPADSGTIDLYLDQVIQPNRNDSPSWSKEIAVTSRLLYEFHKREVVEWATVILPPSYEQNPERRYPSIYIIPGFGGSHRGRQWQGMTGPRQANEGEVEFIRVMLSGQCRWGHHVYANSATNGCANTNTSRIYRPPDRI